MDEDDFRSRCRDHARAFGDPALVHYAAKAFLSVQIARWVAEEGLSLDVCSGGELAIALRADFPPERITLHGNNKSVGELTAAVEAGVGAVVLDSFVEISRLDRIARDRGVVQNVLVRVTVGVEAHTHEYIATAHEDQKFGFSLAGGAAAEAVRRVLRSPGLRLVGLHSHIGSQIFDANAFELSAHRVIGLLADLHKEHGDDAMASVSIVDLGGGLGIAYTADDDPPPPAWLAEQLRTIVSKESEHEGLAMPKIAVEPGRAIVGPTTVTVYEVGTVKELPGLRTYVSVDGGMSDNIRTVLYDAHYTARLASRRSDAEPKRVTLCGKHCESGDIVIRDVPLPADLRPGDLVAVPATGAYGRAMASNYNHVPRPPVIAVRDGQARVIVRRETEDDLMALDVTA
jgi:diaminopimelate decarboxylase